MSKSDVTVVDAPDSISDFFQPDVLPLEEMRERYVRTEPLEPTVGTHCSLLEVVGVLDRREL